MGLIDRQKAIDASKKFIKDCNPDHYVGHQKFIEYMENAEIGSFGNWQLSNGFNLGLKAAEVAIKELPSAEWKKSKWIPVTNGRGGFECENCHHYAPSYQDGVEWLSDYCPNCGAKMDGGDKNAIS